jgi:hypothetical protein
VHFCQFAIEESPEIQQNVMSTLVGPPARHFIGGNQTVCPTLKKRECVVKTHDRSEILYYRKIRIL